MDVVHGSKVTLIFSSQYAASDLAAVIGATNYLVGSAGIFCYSPGSVSPHIPRDY